MKNEWIDKYKREYPFMPFGSILNAYGQINRGSNKPTHEILTDIEKIFDKCKCLVEKQVDSTAEVKVEKQESKTDELFEL